MATSKMTIAESFEEIEALLEELEKEDIPIEEAFEKYQKAMDLLKDCNKSIDKVEKKVLKLMEDGKTQEFTSTTQN